MNIIINTIIWARCIVIGGILGHQNGDDDGFLDGALKQCEDNRHERAAQNTEFFKEGFKTGGENVIKTLLHDKSITEEQRKEAQEILDKCAESIKYKIIGNANFKD